MITLKDRTVLLTIATISKMQTECTFQIEDANGEHFIPPDYDDREKSATCKITSAHQDITAGNFLPSADVIVNCDIHYNPPSEQNGEIGEIFLSNVGVKNRPLSWDFTAVADTEERGHCALNERMLIDWIDALRANDKSLSYVIGEDAVRDYENGNMDSTELHEGHHEIHFNSEELRDVYLQGMNDAIGWMDVSILSTEESKIISNIGEPNKPKMRA